ncbi:N6-Methyl-AMP deaminase-like [Diadema antillarum]|uniref:N6-Methyl-AMP deaminase-like n=1 Tax=Diadema antillarum TaxID=105358 RepID=UPI003A8A8910
MMDETVNLSFCQQLPKVELHAHLNGSISPKTMAELTEKKTKSQNSSLETTVDAIRRWNESVKKREKRILNECFETFKHIHKVVTDVEAVKMVTQDVIREFAEDGVRYLELRSTPRDIPEHGMTKKLYIDAVLKGIEMCEAEGLNIIVKFLPSIDRRMSVEAAGEVVKLALEYNQTTDSKVVGLDLSGDPSKGNMENIVPLLKRARNSGLKLAIHAAERENMNSDSRILLGTPPDRIGHGTFLHTEVGGQLELVDIVERHQIPIEMCLTSNFIGGTVPVLENHHLRFWHRKSHPCVICTDDKGVFSTTLSEEYLLAATTFGMSRRDLWSLSEGAIDHVFASEEVKGLLHRVWKDTRIRLGR